MPTALLYGVSGQDGAYLAKLLLGKGYRVFGVTRQMGAKVCANLVRLGIQERVTLLSSATHDVRSVLNTLAEVEPDEIYNLSGLTSVSLSFERPAEALESIGVATLNLLEAVRIVNPKIQFYNAGSAECFGDTGSGMATENTPFAPRSPYAVAKSTAFWLVKNYREAYGLFACTGILANHESPLRPSQFVSRKIVTAACRIAHGSQETLRLGDVSVVRDWGWAPEYVEAMWRMLQQPQADDFVIGTGTSHALERFVSGVFDSLGLAWEKHVVQSPEFLRPTDIRVSRMNPTKARQCLGWNPQVGFNDLLERLVRDEMAMDQLS